jgi:hypothetical protein
MRWSWIVRTSFKFGVCSFTLILYFQHSCQRTLIQELVSSCSKYEYECIRNLPGIPNSSFAALMDPQRSFPVNIARGLCCNTMPKCSTICVVCRSWYPPPRREGEPKNTLRGKFLLYPAFGREANRIGRMIVSQSTSVSEVTGKTYSSFFKIVACSA